MTRPYLQLVLIAVLNRVLYDQGWPKDHHEAEVTLTPDPLPPPLKYHFIALQHHTY